MVKEAALLLKSEGSCLFILVDKNGKPVHSKPIVLSLAGGAQKEFCRKIFSILGAVRKLPTQKLLVIQMLRVLEKKCVLL